MLFNALTIAESGRRIRTDSGENIVTVRCIHIIWDGVGWADVGTNTVGTNAGARSSLINYY